MILKEAINKHTEWRFKLLTAISKRETLDAIMIKQDNCCPLGKWLHGEGMAQYGNKKSFGDLVAKHAAFHRSAGVVADAVNAKRYDAAEKLLDFGRVYSTASAAVVNAIKVVQKEI